MRKLYIGLMVLVCIFLVSCGEETTTVITNVETYTDITYYLDVYLDDDENTLNVTGSIVYVNDVMDFDELYLTIYPNADNTATTGNNVTFNSLIIDGEEYAVSFSGEDNTAIYIDLENTLEQGDNFLIEFDYEFNYWDYGRIFGDGDYYNTMFFYPFVAVFDDSGWNIDPYNFSGESYYNEVGNYYVSINVPKNFLIACSGKNVDEVVKGRRKTIKYQIDNARDFSFSASSSYKFYEQEINGINFEIYSVSHLTTEELLNTYDYLEDAFRIYSDYIGPYDYDHFTLEYGNIYGMESTGIIYCSSTIEEGTVVHEIVHQWFYSIIGNDQSDYSFIDESLTTFATGIYFKEVYGVFGEFNYYASRDSFRSDLSVHFQTVQNSNMIRKVAEYENEYAYIIYYHGPSMFKYYLDEFLDEDWSLIKTFMNTYYQDYKYDIVDLDELLDLLEETTQVDGTKEWFMFMLNNIQEFENRP